MTQEEKLQLFQTLENKSSRQCEKILLAKNPQALPQERRREVTETQTEIKMVLTEDLVKQLDRLKELWSHKNPRMSDSELLAEMAKFCLSKLDPLQKPPEATTPTPECSKPAKVSRHIPTSLRRLIWQRDQGQCQFKDPQTGHVCHSKHLIQIDHKYPWALGGSHEAKNLRLLCATHNQLRANTLSFRKPLQT